MGIHSGPVSRVVDVNQRVNIAGAGINTAQRVMDCADAGHILLTKRAGNDLAESGQWVPFLHDLGECEVKHGVTLGLVNFFGDDVGNPELPSRFKKARDEQATQVATRRTVLRRRLLLGGILLLALIALSLATYVTFQRKHAGGFSGKSAAAAIPDKSIAVLPFANLSDDKQNAYLADGRNEVEAAYLTLGRRSQGHQPHVGDAILGGRSAKFAQYRRRAGRRPHAGR